MECFRREILRSFGSGMSPGTGLTCTTCQVVFANTDVQRDHYKCDWHRYNLKRKVAKLPPISAEVFAKKEAQQHVGSDDSPSAESNRCGLCNKQFRSVETFQTHCLSKKHQEMQAKSPAQSLVVPHYDRVLSESEAGNVDDEDDGEWMDVDQEQDDGLPPNHCLFCDEACDDCEQSLHHMLHSHGFFIPDAEYCVDMEELLRYLGYKVGVHFVCLWCNERGKAFRSLDAVQKHMRDKQHCKMWHDGSAMLEYSDHYDYSSTYPDAAEAEADSDAPGEVLVESDWQLVLPSGATVGHRSLQRFYRQRLRPEPLPKKRKPSKLGVDKLLNQYRAVGWTGTTGELALRKAKDLQYMNRLVSKQKLRVQVKANQLCPYRNRGRGDQTGN